MVAFVFRATKIEIIIFIDKIKCQKKHHFAKNLIK